MSKLWDWMSERTGKYKTSEIPLDLLLDELRGRYEPSVIPPCPVCGGKLSCQSVGGGGPTVYACQGYEEELKGKDELVRKPGRSVADKHYSDSQFYDYRRGGDHLVIELMDRFNKALFE